HVIVGDHDLDARRRLEPMISGEPALPQRLEMLARSRVRDNLLCEVEWRVGRRELQALERLGHLGNLIGGEPDSCCEALSGCAGEEQQDGETFHRPGDAAQGWGRPMSYHILFSFLPSSGRLCNHWLCSCLIA